MEAEQLKSVLVAFKAKVAEINLDAAIEALEAVYQARESVRRAKAELASVEKGLADARVQLEAVREQTRVSQSKLEAYKAEAAKRLAELA